ncbi:MAG: tetratricopeptide repeat protein [Opitutae bacterium]|nr:tetratricopeptide repeat protein [Opitutae bacterium]
MRRLLFLLSLACTTAGFAADLAEAKKLFEARRVPEARALLEPLVAANPADAAALCLLAQCELRMQKHDEAMAHLEQAVKLAPTNAEIQTQYGLACLDAARRAKSLSSAKKGRTALEKAIELNPDALDSREALAIYYSQAPWIAGGSKDKAFAQAKEIARRDATRGFALTISLKNGDKAYAESVALCEEALRRNPDDYVALFELGRTASISGENAERGLTSLRRCLTLTPPPRYPNHAGVHYRIALLLQKQGDNAGARTELETALKLAPDNRQFMDALAQLTNPAR